MMGLVGGLGLQGFRVGPCSDSNVKLGSSRQAPADLTGGNTILSSDFFKQHFFLSWPYIFCMYILYFDS